MTTYSISDRPVDPLSQPSNSGQTYVNTSNNYDVAVAGLPFFIGPNQQYPYKRETAQYRKQQIDQQKEPGEQTLTGWWLRSQSSFHYGAGIRYEEPIQGETVGYRFNKSAGVDVFNIGRVTLLPDVTKLATTPAGAPLMAGGIDSAGKNVVIWADGSNLYRTEFTSTGVYSSQSTLTWGGSGTIYAVAQDGLNYYAANSTGIYKGPLTGASSGTSVFTYPTSTGTISSNSISLGWVKQRLIAGVNNYIFEVTPITTYTVTAASLSNNVATLKTDSVAHNFSVGSQVTVTGISTDFNGTWSVTAVTPTEFSYYHSHANQDLLTGLTGSAVLASNNNLPIYVHPNTNWRWTGICEGPNAIYIAGYAGDSSTVYRLALDTTGAIPLLTKALTAADMPKGEQIYALGSYVGKYMVFGTSKGIRIGTIDTSGFVSSGFITYGPLTVVTNGYDPASGTFLNGKPVKSITFNDRYAYCTVTNYIDNGDGTFSSGLVKIDLSREITPNQMAYATHLRVPSIVEAAAVVVIGATNKLAIGVTGVGVYYQNDTLVKNGYLQTGQVRYFTLEDKHFELVKLRETLPMLGTLKLTSIDSNGTVNDIITVDNTFDFTQDITGLDQFDLYPKESIALKFTFYSATNQADGTSDSFNGYQLKALPAVRRQRIYTVPLLNFDFEADKNNMAVGYEGRAAERLVSLESIESNGDVIVFQDFTNNETVRGVIESLTFIRMTPPERRFSGFGGMILMQLRTV